MRPPSRGIPGYDHLLTDFSPSGFEARAEHTRRGLAELTSLPVTSDDDRLARDFITERFTTSLLAHDTGEWQRTLRAIAAPPVAAQHVRSHASQHHRRVGAHRGPTPRASRGARRAPHHLRARARPGHVAARRQAVAAADQADTWAEDQWFGTLAEEAAANAALPPTLVAAVRDGAAVANAAYADFARYLRDMYAPAATIEDGCGPERYRVGVRQMLGADFDPIEMYEWAWCDFHEFRADIRATCERVLPGAGFAEVIHLLDTTPTGRCTAPTPTAMAAEDHR